MKKMYGVILVLLLIIGCDTGYKKNPEEKVKAPQSEKKTNPDIKGIKIHLGKRRYDVKKEYILCNYVGAEDGDIILQIGDKNFKNLNDFKSCTGNSPYMILRKNKIIKRPSMGRAWSYCYKELEVVSLTDKVIEHIKIENSQDRSKKLIFEGNEGDKIANMPPGFPSDPFGGEYYRSNKSDPIFDTQKNQRNHNIRLYRNLKYPESQGLALKRAKEWINYYETHLLKQGYITSKKKLGELMGPWVMYSLSLVNFNPQKTLTINNDVIYQLIHIYYGDATTDFWVINYTEIIPNSTKERMITKKLESISNNNNLSDTQKRDKIMILQNTYGQEIVTSILRNVPIYNSEDQKFETFDSFMRKLANDNLTDGNSPLSKDPVGAAIRIINDPSEKTIKDMLGLGSW